MTTSCKQLPLISDNAQPLFVLMVYNFLLFLTFPLMQIKLIFHNII